MDLHKNPDPAFYLNADPDLGSQTNANSDPGQTLKSQKVGFLHENVNFMWEIISQKTYRTYVGTKAFLKGWESGLLLNLVILTPLVENLKALWAPAA